MEMTHCMVALATHDIFGGKKNHLSFGDDGNDHLSGGPDDCDFSKGYGENITWW